MRQIKFSQPSLDKFRRVADSVKIPTSEDSKELVLPFIGSKEASSFLGYNYDALRNMRSLNTGPSFHKLSEGRVVYQIADLVEWAGERIDPASCTVED